MLPIHKRVVQSRFNPYQRRVFGVCLLLLLNSVQRRQWVHPYNLDFHQKGEFFITYPDLRKYSEKFFRTYRMSVCQFDNLLYLLRPVIEKNDNNYRESISAEEHLVITLRYVILNNYNQFDVELTCLLKSVYYNWFPSFYVTRSTLYRD